MRKLHINSIQPGDQVGKTVFSANGTILIGYGVKLNQIYIERLKMLGIDSLYIEDRETADIVPDGIIKDETRQKAIDSVYTAMTELMNQPQVVGRMATPELGNKFHKIFSSILNDIKNRKTVMINLTNLHSMDAYLFHHAVNVSILSGIVGMNKGYNYSQLIELGVGALLFDIGMTKIPPQLWKKTSPLTYDERELINGHTNYGYDLLRNQSEISMTTALCALQHHERYIGTGYPRQLKGSQIHEYAQIIALADVYDALTTPRTYRQRYSPSEAIEFLYAAGNEYFDYGLVKIFLKHISVYPVSSTVVLSTGQVGVVSSVNPSAINRPVIRILKEKENGINVASPYEIDLNKHLNIVITQTL